MDKYRKAYEFYKRLVASYEDPEEGKNTWWKMLQGIHEVALYDSDITEEEFNEILNWR